MVATQVSGGARSTEDGHRLGENLVSRKRCLNWINTALQAHSPTSTSIETYENLR